MSGVLMAGRLLKLKMSEAVREATLTQADLVISADGSSSRMCEIVQPGLQSEYPGDRGAVPTRNLCAELVNTIELRTTFLHVV
jgi:hypothetical protein